MNNDYNCFTVGANEEQLKKAKSHKKGHVSKGFKSSSSKNEEEKSESFYDEAHDESDHKVAGHNAGSFGENSEHGFKGAHEEKILDANAQGKEGHHVSEQKVDDAKANKVNATYGFLITTFFYLLHTQSYYKPRHSYIFYRFLSLYYYLI